MNTFPNEENLTPSQEEMLMKYLDGRLGNDETASFHQMMMDCPEARAWLREAAEHAVAVVDAHRCAAVEQVDFSNQESTVVRPNSRFYLAAIASAAAIWMATLIFTSMGKREAPVRLSPARITSAEGAFSLLGDDGSIRLEVLHEDAEPTFFEVGETLSSQGGDSILQFELPSGVQFTMAGYAELRRLPSGSANCFYLHTGSVWSEPADKTEARPLIFKTPMAHVDLSEDCQFDLHAKNGFTRLRVNQGEARVRRTMDGMDVLVKAGHMIQITPELDRSLQSQPQPKPVHSWSCDQLEAPDILLGHWSNQWPASTLPPYSLEVNETFMVFGSSTPKGRTARRKTQAQWGTWMTALKQVLPPVVLGVMKPEPSNHMPSVRSQALPWRISDDRRVLLYATAFSVSRSGPNPVVLLPGSRLRFLFSFQRAYPIRFGFAGQQLHKPFEGKYELDVLEQELGEPGRLHMMDIPVDAFQSKRPSVLGDAYGLEVDHVYALNLFKDAGLVLHKVEILGPEETQGGLID